MAAAYGAKLHIEPVIGVAYAASQRLGHLCRSQAIPIITQTQTRRAPPDIIDRANEYARETEELLAALALLHGSAAVAEEFSNHLDLIALWIDKVTMPQQVDGRPFSTRIMMANIISLLASIIVRSPDIDQDHVVHYLPSQPWTHLCTNVRRGRAGGAEDDKRRSIS